MSVRKKQGHQIRLNIYVSEKVAAEVSRECRFRRGATKSAIVESALRERFNPLREDLTKSLLKSAHKLRGDLRRLERISEFNVTALACFIRLWLCYHPSLPEEERSAAELSAQRRFKRFVTLALKDLSFEELVSGDEAVQRVDT